nr:hypothetical protein [Enterobacter cloacae]MDV1068916.1 hypothetical protein [Enterobacter cloacae]MDV1085798.1 hypothetical protein [Enterobacter cloacae]
MSGVMVLANSVVVLILIFVLWCVLFRSRDVKFAFLNLFRHKRRSYSTIAAIMLGGVSIFLYGGGFVNGMVASHLLCHSGTINRHSLNG